MILPADIASGFELGGTIVAAQVHGRGLINDTYLVATTSRTAPRVILQRLNRRAFPQPELLMENLGVLLRHIVARQQTQRDHPEDLRFPVIYRARNGRDFVIDVAGDLWRAMSYIEHTLSFQRLHGAEQARETGRALGRFHGLVSDLDMRQLHDLRPDFHHTPRHLERLDQLLARVNIEATASAEVRLCLAFIDEHRRGIDAIETALDAGVISRRPIHGDPKLDNFLFDENNGRAVSLVDLDTFKPGIVHHDIADCLRSCCNVVGESPGNGEIVRYDIEICRAVLTGYFLNAEDAGRDVTVEHLYAAIRLIPFELGLRFLADYLAGNPYFKIEFPEQNLRRAITQFQLVTDIERQQAMIEDMIADLMPR